jgi:hypothetical protein
VRQLLAACVRQLAPIDSASFATGDGDGGLSILGTAAATTKQVPLSSLDVYCQRLRRVQPRGRKTKGIAPPPGKSAGASA